MKLEISGKTYELEYTINAMCDLEELTGQSLVDSLGAGSFASIRGLLWAGLSEHTEGLTLKQAGTLLQDYIKQHGMDKLVEQIMKAIEAAGFSTAQGAAQAKK